MKQATSTSSGRITIKSPKINIFNYFKSLNSVFLKVLENNVTSEFRYFRYKGDYFNFLCFLSENQKGRSRKIKRCYNRLSNLYKSWEYFSKTLRKPNL